MKRHWPVIVALVLIYAGLYFDLNFIWGILFLVWTFPSIYTREVHLVQNIERDESPVLYWLILLTWIALGILLILMDVPKIVHFLQS